MARQWRERAHFKVEHRALSWGASPVCAARFGYPKLVRDPVLRITLCSQRSVDNYPRRHNAAESVGTELVFTPVYRRILPIHAGNERSKRIQAPSCAYDKHRGTMGKHALRLFLPNLCSQDSSS